jgi:hypothetical protein
VTVLDKMFGLNDNPFAVLTAVVAPAVLTNASSVLCLGISNRIGRVADRTRVVAAEIAPMAVQSEEYQILLGQLERLQSRAELLFRALRLSYASLGSFAAAALVSVIGSAIAFYGQQWAFRTAAAIAFAVGGFGVGALVYGCAMTVRETRLALLSIAEESKLARTRFGIE